MIWTNEIYKLKYTYALNLMKKFNMYDIEVRKDLAQETMTKVVLHYKERDGCSINTFIYRVAKNHVIDYVRKAKRNVLVASQTLYENVYSSNLSYSLNNIETEYLRKEQKEYCINIIDKLPLKQRNLVHSRYLEELSYGEIAEKYSINVGAVKSGLYRAKGSLQKIINRKSRIV